MTVLAVPTMHCENCVKRISGALTNAKIPFEISLVDKTVSVEADQLTQALELLDDLGFDGIFPLQ